MRNRTIALLAVLKVLIILSWFVGLPGVARLEADAATKAADETTAKAPGGERAKGGASDAVAKEQPGRRDDLDQSKALVAALAKRQKELDAREEALKAAEDRLKSIKGEVEARIADLKKLHGTLEELARKIDDADTDRNKRLVKIYETMAPEEASSRIEKLDDATAVQILSSMNEKKAAKVLGIMSVERSVKLTKSIKSIKDPS